MEKQGAIQSRSIYTIGHSNHSESLFLDLLNQHRIDVLVDVRSHPYCRYTVHFNREPLSESLTRAGVRYVFLGEQLGGRPDGLEFYDEEGRVLYSEVARSTPFLDAVGRILDDSEQDRLCLMCSEEDPTVCHRYLLVGRVLAGRSVTVRHIRKNGAAETDADLAGRQATGDRQRLLFEDSEEPPWKSLRSVLRKPRPRSSLES